MDSPPPPPPPRLSWSDRIFLVGALILVAAIGTGLAWTFLSKGDGEAVRRPSVTARTGPPAGKPSAITSSPSSESACQAVHTVPPFNAEPGDRAHADVPLSRYPSAPPASGPHDPSPLPAGFYGEPPPVGEVLHSLEHGAVVIWFEPSLASSEGFQQMVEFMGPSGPGQGLHVIIAPYLYPNEGAAGELPSGVAVALVGWHRLQTCAELDADTVQVAAGFVAKYRCQPGCDPSPYLGDAPEAGAPL